MWVEYRAHAAVCQSAQRSARSRQCPAQPWEKYHAAGLVVAGRHRSVHDHGGGVNAVAFEAYLEHILVPSLSPGQIVVMDNLSAHKGARVRHLIEERGCQL